MPGWRAKRWEPRNTRRRKASEARRKRNAESASWRRLIVDLWGKRCLWPHGYCQGDIEIMHAYSRGAHPEWRYEPWNGFPGCVFHHRLARSSFEFHPAGRRALKACADLVREAHEGNRPMPTWEELQRLVSRIMLEG